MSVNLHIKLLKIHDLFAFRYKVQICKRFFLQKYLNPLKNPENSHVIDNVLVDDIFFQVIQIQLYICLQVQDTFINVVFNFSIYSSIQISLHLFIGVEHVYKCSFQHILYQLDGVAPLETDPPLFNSTLLITNPFVKHPITLP